MSDRARHARAQAREHQRQYAERYGYFWLPCPLCHEEFGGHEAAGSIATDDPERLRKICPCCTAERQQAAEQHLAELGRAYTLTLGSSGRDCMRHIIGLNPSGESTGNTITLEIT